MDFFKKRFRRINIEEYVYIVFRSFDHLICAEEKSKSLTRCLFVVAFQRRNPAHMDSGDACWDPCQFCFHLRGAASSCAACVGTPRRELKEKCQYCVGGQSRFTRTSRSWGGCTVIGSKSPQFVRLASISSDIVGRRARLFTVAGTCD